MIFKSIHQLNPKHNLQNPNIQQNKKLKLKKTHLYTSKHKSYLLTYFL
jgi:hypothetical protein